MRLTTEEMRFFKRNGYLIKRSILDPDLMARARARLWDGAPPCRKCDDPDTWIGPFAEEEESADRSNARRGFRWNFREPGGEEWMVRLLPKNPDIWAMAEQLLGAGELIEHDRIRGIYCTLPYGDHPVPELTCHCDAHAFHLGVVGYIDRVDPGGGSFTVWPGSHLEFYYAHASQYKSDKTEDYARLCEHFNGQEPVDCYGEPGDIVFWHHRLGHMASPNTTRQIRQAVLYDYVKKDVEETQEEPPQEDMWRDWSEALRALDPP